MVTFESTQATKKARNGMPVVSLTSLARVSGLLFWKQSILCRKGSCLALG